MTDKTQHRIDGWRNLATGQGVAHGKLSYEFNVGCLIPDQLLSKLYRWDPIVGTAVNTVPKDATRQGWKWQIPSVKGVDKLLTAKLEDLGAPAKLLKAWVWARLYGGCLILLGCDDGLPPDLPLNLNGLKGVRFLTVLEKQYCYPERMYNDPLSPRYGTPELYRITTIEGVTATVHASRVLRFDGEMTTREGEAENGGWSDSIVLRMYTALLQFAGGNTAISSLLGEASVGVLMIKDLVELLSGDYSDAVKKRFEYMDLAKSATNSILVDAENEDYKRVEVGALTGAGDIYDKILLAVSQACRIPVTILFGQSPAGLTATGDSDVRWFYDSVKSEQTQILKPALETLAKLIFRSSEGPTKGVEPESYCVEFPPLWQPSPQEQANTRKTEAETDEKYLAMGVRTPEQISQARFGEPLSTPAVPVTASPPVVVESVPVPQTTATPVDPTAPPWR